MFIRIARRIAPILALAALAVSLSWLPSAAASNGNFPGGFVEKCTSGEVRPKLTGSALRSLVPARGGFTFPAPWNTEAVRITTTSDCSGDDCVIPVGYSYWRNMNNHTGSDTMLIFLGLGAGHGGPSLFSYNKITDVVTPKGPLFDSSNPLSGATGEGWYFSATMPHALYVNSGSRLYRYDVVAKKMSQVYDAASQFGGGIYIWQMHSSDDDRMHVATVRSSSSYEMMGCLAYNEPIRRFSWYPARGRLDECHVDKAGRYMVMLDNVDGANGEDNRIIDLVSGRETVVMDEQGAAGHADTGYGYIVNEDNWNSEPGAVVVRSLGTLTSRIVYHTSDWGLDVGHIAHGNAHDGGPESQFACSSNATHGDMARGNEIVCFRLDGSMDVLVVAPVMTDMSASGGGDDYSKTPKGNLDVTGQYMLWTSNMGGSRVDAFVVKIPVHRLMGGSTVASGPSGFSKKKRLTIREAMAEAMSRRRITSRQNRN